MHDCNYTGVAMNIEKKKKKVMGDVKIWCNFLGVAIDILFKKKMMMGYGTIGPLNLCLYFLLYILLWSSCRLL